MDEHSFDLGELLRTARDKQVGMRWPVPVDARLDGLLARATAAGERTTRRELVAALIATTDLDGPALGQVLRRYRTMSVREAMLDVDDGSKVVRIAGHRPGPRSGMGGGAS